MTRPNKTVPVEVIAANIESRRFSPKLRRLIKEHKPDVVIAEQAFRARRFLASIKGYQAHQWQDKPGGEWSGIAVLVRNDVDVMSVKPLVMSMSWTGPKAGKRHEPRVYPALVLRKEGVFFRVLGIHFPTHNQPMQQKESAQAIAAYFRSHDNSPVIAAGDWNRRADELDGLAQLARAELIPLGKVDHALVARLAHRRTKRLPKPHYAHGWALYRFDLDR